MIYSIFQFTVYIGGILGALLFNKTILRIYWLFMIPLLLFDLVKAICWAIQLRDMHRHYSKFIQQITDAQVHYGNSMSICSEWYSIQMGLKCCSPTNILRFCNYTGSIWEDAEMEKLLTLCESKTIYSCANPLLRWFHSEIDLLAIIAYFVLLPLKLIVVGVLRRDIQEVFGEIVYSGNRHLYMHWAAFDSRDEGIALSASLHNNTDTVTSTTALMKTQRTFEE
uniref:Tetraspanin n=1 Tax=Parascaris univalens TaxID=6257 RepID=A0A915C4Z5_PARUN